VSSYRAEVIETTPQGVYVRVWRSPAGRVSIGPCPTLVPDLAPGTPVLVVVLDERSDHYAVLGPLVPPVT